MPIYKNNKKVSAIYRGGTPISKVYRGETLVYQVGNSFPIPNTLFISGYDDINGADDNYTIINKVDSVQYPLMEINPSYGNIEKKADLKCLRISPNSTQAQICGLMLQNITDDIDNRFKSIVIKASNTFQYDDREANKNLIPFGSIYHYPLFAYNNLTDNETQNIFTYFSRTEVTGINPNDVKYIIANVHKVDSSNMSFDSIYFIGENHNILFQDEEPFQFALEEDIVKVYFTIGCNANVQNVYDRQYLDFYYFAMFSEPQTVDILPTLDEYFGLPQPSTNSFKGKFATSGDKTIKVNNTNYIIHTDDNGNFNQEYSGDNITQITFNYADIQEVTEMPDMSNVTNMNNMFYNCSWLTSLDLSNFNTSNVTNMSYMFYECISLSSLDLSNFNTSKVDDMSYMFYSCNSLTSLDLSNFDTSKVTNMNSMFEGCSGLTSLDLSGWDTSKVNSMKKLFYKCISLSSLDLSNFNTTKVDDMGYMFYYCGALTLLDLTNFNTSKVTNMNSMFYNCSGLTSLDVSNFNTTNVDDMSYMFGNCSKLTSLDLTNWDMSNVTSMRYMFTTCYGLQHITCTQATKDKMMTLDTTAFPTKNTVQWTIV